MTARALSAMHLELSQQVNRDIKGRGKISLIKLKEIRVLVLDDIKDIYENAELHVNPRFRVGIVGDYDVQRLDHLFKAWLANDLGLLAEADVTKCRTVWEKHIRAHFG
jgi:hypothetical protein